MRSLFYAAAAIAMAGALCTGLGSCRNENKDEDNAEALNFYSKSLRITRDFIDSIRDARDSATVERLDVELDHALTNLNYDFPPEIYLKLGEGENDTLANLSLRFAHLRDSLLHRFANPIELPADSLAADSAAAAPAR